MQTPRGCFRSYRLRQKFREWLLLQVQVRGRIVGVWSRGEAGRRRGTEGLEQRGAVDVRMIFFRL